MNFSIYIDDEMAEQFNRIAKQTGKSRNALIREALREWIVRRKRSRWPREILEFKGVKECPRFEDYRRELKPPRDPFDDLSS